MNHGMNVGIDSGTLALEQIMRQAVTHQQGGHFQEAGELYLSILQAHPKHPDANHNMGILALQLKQPVASLPYFMTALDVEPTRGQFWLSYIDALFQADQLEDARQILALAQQSGLEGDEVEALAMRLKEGKSFAEQPNTDFQQVSGDTRPISPADLQNSTKKTKPKPAKPNKSVASPPQGESPSPQEIDTLAALFTEECFAEALTLAQAMTLRCPLHQFGWKVLGLVFQQMGQSADALAPMQKAAALSPNDAEAQSNLGNTLSDLGRSGEAEVCHRRALEINPYFAAMHSNLGATLYDLGRLDEAEASYRQALRIKPDLAIAHYNLGNILQKLDRQGEAEASYRRALEIKPDHAGAHNNLGNTLKDLGRMDEAEASYQRALQIKPDYAEAHSNLGNTLKDLGRTNEAEASYRRALDIMPDLAEAHNNLGIILQNLLRLDEAEASYRQALQIKPDYKDAFSNLLFTLNYHPNKSSKEIFEAYQEYDSRIGRPQQSEWRPHGNRRETNRRLKVGYVSPDFKKHSVRHFLEPLLAHHDKRVVEVYAYAELAREDSVTARYKKYVDHWIPTRGLSDKELAERIRADGIDILVDMAGHTDKNRLGVFARKPAPVSLSWLGYGYTTGLTAIDYFLTDGATVPVGSEDLFSEKPWRLTTPGFVYRPAEDMGETNPLPAMNVGHITFGTLSRGIRINHRVIRVWSDILKHVEGSKLVLDSKDFRDTYMQKILVEKFAAHGISRDQLLIGFHSPPWDILRGLDIGLDCFPHNSGTTLFEFLYMGIPYITLKERPSVGRIGSSILESIGHPEWISKTEDEYVEKAIALATNLPKLAIQRTRLRQEMQGGPLMNEPVFAHAVETAYRQMFEKWTRELR